MVSGKSDQKSGVRIRLEVFDVSLPGPLHPFPASEIVLSGKDQDPLFLGKK